ncbi:MULTISPECIES: DUF2635 domain-containing protein [Telluria group]|jgi:hypothetical protein|uniref:DUF2635 domain-containing protein n=1 Tax=Telluria group TaxID=2895353 RepID=UPI00088DDE5F|nr:MULTISPECIES: DUF2635 domain-containing protein [unclassified Duganella]SDH06037.1 Protein of unknown function [Duganella sp. OV458]SDK20057.1 Protein of unknown function [Duganella sp. OV510]
MLVKPANGLVIRDPDLLDLIPETGREVPETDYWMRRLRDKDVVLVEPAAAPVKQSAKGSTD